MVKLLNMQCKAKADIHSTSIIKKEAETFNAPPLPQMKFYMQHKTTTRMEVIAGLSHQAEDAAKWWDEIDKLREKYCDDTDSIVEALADSGKYPIMGHKDRGSYHYSQKGN